MKSAPAQELLGVKQSGGRWTAGQIDAIVKGVCSGAFSDAQAGALTMAVFLRGLSVAETAILTESMARSGRVLEWDRNRLDGPVVDKHSTGGVGDMVSLVLGPMLAAVGCHVPMISGRALGPMGGTLDKLESIPGYRPFVPVDRFAAVVQDVGVAIVGASEELVPADSRLYRIRDETATVNSIPLITASILSKKLAEGLDALAVDVKIGSGAVFANVEAARTLMDWLQAVAEDLGLDLTILASDMNQPLAPSVGNGLEVRQAIDYLVGSRRPERVHEIVLAVGEGVLVRAGMDQGRKRLLAVLEDGSAAEVFARMVAELGGPSKLIERPGEHLPRAPCVGVVRAAESGYVSAVDAAMVGRLVFRMGGGRARSGDAIDHAVGLSEICQVGDRVSRDDPVARVHAPTPDALDRVQRALRETILIGSEPVKPESALLDLDGENAHKEAS